MTPAASTEAGRGFRVIGLRSATRGLRCLASVQQATAPHLRWSARATKTGAQWPVNRRSPCCGPARGWSDDSAASPPGPGDCDPRAQATRAGANGSSACARGSAASRHATKEARKQFMPESASRRCWHLFVAVPSGRIPFSTPNPPASWPALFAARVFPTALTGPAAPPTVDPAVHRAPGLSSGRGCDPRSQNSDGHTIFVICPDRAQDQAPKRNPTP